MLDPQHKQELLRNIEVMAAQKAPQADVQAMINAYNAKWDKAPAPQQNLADAAKKGLMSGLTLGMSDIKLSAITELPGRIGSGFSAIGGAVTGGLKRAFEGGKDIATAFQPGGEVKGFGPSVMRGLSGGLKAAGGIAESVFAVTPVGASIVGGAGFLAPEVGQVVNKVKEGYEMLPENVKSNLASAYEKLPQEGKDLPRSVLDMLLIKNMPKMDWGDKMKKITDKFKKPADLGSSGLGEESPGLIRRIVGKEEEWIKKNNPLNNEEKIAQVIKEDPYKYMANRGWNKTKSQNVKDIGEYNLSLKEGKAARLEKMNKPIITKNTSAMMQEINKWYSDVGFSAQEIKGGFPFKIKLLY